MGAQVFSAGALLITVLFVVFLTALPPAFAHWSSSGTGSSTASVATLLPPSSVSVPVNSDSNVVVSWTAPAAGVLPTGYYVTRISGSTTMPACKSSKTTLVSGPSCTDDSVPLGTHQYQVTAVYRSWTAVSAASGSVNVKSDNVLTFSVQPVSELIAGSAEINVSVKARTVLGLAAAGVSVTISIGNNPGGGMLLNPATGFTDLFGNVIFKGLAIDKAGTGYTLLASSPGYSAAISNKFSVVPAAPSKLIITEGAEITGPASDTATLGPITVQRQDAFGNAVTAGSTVVPLATNSTGVGIFAAAANGTAVTMVTITAGSSTALFFYGDTKVGTPTITASATGLAAADPVIATVTAAAPSKLQLGPVPLTVTVNHPFSPQVQVHILDAFGNRTGSTAEVTVQSNCSLNMTPASVHAVSGSAVFADLAVTERNTGCMLTANSGTLAPAASLPFDAI